MKSKSTIARWIAIGLVVAYFVFGFILIVYRNYQATHYNKTHEQVTRLK